MKQYQYILIDWDGNLAKTLDIWLESFRQVFKSHGHVISDELITANFGHVDNMYGYLGISDYTALHDEVNATVMELMPTVKLYPDAIEVLQYLGNSNKKLALVTSSRKQLVQHVLNKHHIHNLFDAIVTSEDVANHKPHPEPLEKALELLSGTREAAIMIGDSDVDIISANSAGIDSILFLPPEHSKYHDLDKFRQLPATYIVQDFRQIKELIK